MKKFLSKTGGFVKRHKFLTALVIIAGAAGVYLLVRTPAATTTNSAVRSVILDYMDLEQIVTTSGSVSSATVTYVSPKAAAAVQHVYVKVGDKVSSGDKLAQLDPASVDKQIKSLDESLSDARKKINDQISAEQKKLDSYKAAYAEEKKNLDKSVADAKAKLDAAAAAEESRAGAAADLDSSVVPLRLAMDAAKAAWDADPSDDALKSAYEAARLAWQAGWQASFALNYTPANFASESEDYASAFAARETALKEIQARIDASSATIAALKDNDQIKSLEKQISDLKDQKKDLTITAPVSGTVTTANAIVGANATAGMFIIQDLSEMQVTAEVAEYDVVSLKSGMKVEIVSDAIPEGSWSGSLIRIAPIATAATGGFQITVDIRSELAGLLGGMSARLSIVTQTRTHVFAVPYDCVVQDEAGRSLVYVLETQAPAGQTPSGQTPSGQTPSRQTTSGTSAMRAIAVTTGLETAYYVEISSADLKAGMMIVHDPLNVNTQPGRINFSIGGGNR